MYRLDRRKCPKTFLCWCTAPSSGQIGHVHQDLVVHQATSFLSVYQNGKMSVRTPLHFSAPRQKILGTLSTVQTVPMYTLRVTETCKCFQLALLDNKRSNNVFKHDLL